MVGGCNGLRQPDWRNGSGWGARCTPVSFVFSHSRVITRSMPASHCRTRPAWVCMKPWVSQPVGIYRGVGYKLGSWHDVGWWQLSLQPESDEPPAPRSIREIRHSRAVQEALEAGENWWALEILWRTYDLSACFVAPHLWHHRLFAGAAASTSAGGSGPEDIKRALESLSSEDLLRHTRVLSSDEYEGRAPGTRGEELSVKYLTEQFQKLGLKPGNPDGSYVQKVPLAGFTPESQASFVAGKEMLSLKPQTDYVAVCRRTVPEVKVENSDLVFVGYGVVAPEYGWDDYKGVDVKGKTIVMLINDPAVPDPTDPSKLDEKMFKGRAMTYYGRWTYKYEIASEKGAAAAIIIHETGPAGYPFEVVSGSWGRENFDLRRPDKNMGRVAVESWISLDTARKLLKLGGQDFDTLKKAAINKDFKPVPLKAKANFTVKNTLREVDSQNVIAKLEGSDPTLKNEYVVYSAHWDHLGKDEKLRAIRSSTVHSTMLRVLLRFWNWPRHSLV